MNDTMSHTLLSPIPPAGEEVRVEAVLNQATRELGWSDRDIFDAIAQAANNRAFNFMLKTFKVHRQGTFA